ncbi:Pycsar system effector family protein [Streptomyces sp. NPDC020996]|uniref:Pycsar system effector family protein n=1 Tax=Streptomyces sp. NPDC020996 TaxID=3154791 RepID=UPI0033E1EC7E
MTALDPPPAPPPSPPAAPGDGPAGLLPLCERLLTELRAELARADNKASVLVGALGMTAGVCGGLLAGRSWTPAALSSTGAVLWWAGVTALVLSLFALLLTVLPRYRATRWEPGQPLSYFGDIQEAVRLGRLESALDTTRQDPAAALAAALTDTSRIAARKHQWIRVGLIAFCAGTLLLPAALLLG